MDKMISDYRNSKEKIFKARYIFYAFIGLLGLGVELTNVDKEQ